VNLDCSFMIFHSPRSVTRSTLRKPSTTVSQILRHALLHITNITVKRMQRRSWESGWTRYHENRLFHYSTRKTVQVSKQTRYTRARIRSALGRMDPEDRGTRSSPEREFPFFAEREVPVRRKTTRNKRNDSPSVTLSCCRAQITHCLQGMEEKLASRCADDLVRRLKWMCRPDSERGD